jgi:hypothetical protein
VAGFVAASSAVAAHQVVGFDRAPLTATAGDPAEVPINLHRTDRVTVTVDGPDGGFTAVVVDDGDGAATLVIETAATDDTPFRVESGSLRRVTGGGDPLVPGEYEVSLSVRRGVGDATTLTLTPATTDRRVTLPAVVGGLLGPLVPVVVLAAAARVTRRGAVDR